MIAIVPIQKGTCLFPGDEAEMRWIREQDLPPMPRQLRKLYDDFCVRKGDIFGCPKSFNDLNAAWYLNHSDQPNVVCDSNYKFFALCDIQEGEELTVDYRTYSDHLDFLE